MGAGGPRPGRMAHPYWDNLYFFCGLRVFAEFSRKKKTTRIIFSSVYYLSCILSPRCQLMLPTSPFYPFHFQYSIGLKSFITHGREQYPFSFHHYMHFYDIFQIIILVAKNAGSKWFFKLLFEYDNSFCLVFPSHPQTNASSNRGLQSALCKHALPCTNREAHFFRVVTVLLNVSSCTAAG